MCSEGLRERYVNPYTDFAFKLLFGTDLNKEILIGFLNALFDGKQVIEDVTYLNTEHLGSKETDRRAVFDVYCENEKGEKILIEMQRGEQQFFKDRSIYYATYPIREQAIKGEIWNYELKAVYVIGILNFALDDVSSSGFRHEVKLMDTTTHEVFFDKLTFVYLEMPKFHKTEQELDTLFDKWMFVLKNLARLMERPTALQERVFNRLFEAAEIAQFSKENLYAYEESLKVYRDWNNVIDTAIQKGIARGMEEGIAKGMEEGIAKGMEEGIVKGMEEGIAKGMEKGIAEGEWMKAQTIAGNLKNAGLSIAEIAKVTGLSEDEINSL